jgi:hypothetical protein
VTQQHAATGELDDALIGPRGQQIARRVAERAGRELERLAADCLVVGRAVAAAAGLGARHRLLLVVAGDVHVEAVADHRHDVLAVAAATDRVAEERAQLRAARPRVVEARRQRGEVAVRSTHRRQPRGPTAISCVTHGGIIPWIGVLATSPGVRRSSHSAKSNTTMWSNVARTLATATWCCGCGP